jgi:hypothetical protein
LAANQLTCYVQNEKKDKKKIALKYCFPFVVYFAF